MLSVSIEKLSYSVIAVKELSFCMSAVEEMSHSQCYSREVISHYSDSKRSCLTRNRGTPQWWTGQQRKVWFAKVHAGKRPGVHSGKGIETCHTLGQQTVFLNIHINSPACTTRPGFSVLSSFVFWSGRRLTASLLCVALCSLHEPAVLMCQWSHSEIEPATGRVD